MGGHSLDRYCLRLAVVALPTAHQRLGWLAARLPELARALATITSVIDVLDYTAVTAAHHARLLAHVRKPGSPRGAHDLIIAAHAAETGRLVLSRDAKARFGDLPGITAIDV